MTAHADSVSRSIVDHVMDHARIAGNDDMRALACILVHRCNCPTAPYRRALGLEGAEARALVDRFFPSLLRHWPTGDCLRRHLGQDCPDCDPPPDRHGRFSASLLEQEEQDLCRLFLSHVSDPGLWPVVFARLIARACMEPEHLWMSLGLENRDQLSGILVRHFPALAARNDRDMRWKKFFYKLLCDIEKVWTCTASSCEICPHHLECYAPEL